MQQEFIMQRRYCTCGNLVLVHFVRKHLSWRTIFRSPDISSATNIHHCPACGQKLAIDVLH